MDESDFEGTLVLEKLSSIGKLEEFFDAVDADDFKKARSLMKLAGLDSDSITLVLNQMADSDGDH